MPASPSVTRALFAAQLKKLRNERGFKTARKLAQSLDIDENRYTRYERAEVEPDLSLFVRICEVLRTTPNELLGVGPREFAEAENPPIGPAASVPERRSHKFRALARRLAREIADARSARGQESDPLGRLQEISRIVAEVEAEPFDYVARLPMFPELRALDKASQQRVAAVAERLVEAFEDAFVAGVNPGSLPRSPSSPRR